MFTALIGALYYKAGSDGQLALNIATEFVHRILRGLIESLLANQFLHIPSKSYIAKQIMYHDCLFNYFYNVDQ